MQKAKENFFFHFGNKFEYYDNLTKKKNERECCVGRNCMCYYKKIYYYSAFCTLLCIIYIPTLKEIKILFSTNVFFIFCYNILQFLHHNM